MNETFVKDFIKYMKHEDINEILRDIMDLYEKIKELESPEAPSGVGHSLSTKATTDEEKKDMLNQGAFITGSFLEVDLNPQEVDEQLVLEDKKVDRTGEEYNPE